MLGKSLGRSNFNRTMIDICAHIEPKDTLVVDVPKIESDGYILHTIHVEYEWKPSRCPTCKLFDHSLD